MNRQIKEQAAAFEKQAPLIASCSLPPPMKKPLRPTRLGPTEAEKVAELEALEAHARQLGVLLEGRKEPFGDHYRVIARRADTRAALRLSFRVNEAMAQHHAQFMAALHALLAEALAVLADE